MNQPAPQQGGTSKRRQIVSAVVLIVLGAAVLIYAVVSAGLQRQKTQGYTAIQGTVVAHQEIIGRDRNDSPIIRYAEIVVYPMDGMSYKVVSPVAKTNPAAVGSVMAVQYDPAKPDQAILPDQAAQTRLVVLIAGGSCLLLGAFLLAKSRTLFRS